MKNRKSNKLHPGLLTVILTLSLLASNVLIVNADAGGTGKFLEINFEGDGIIESTCNVTATKISSGQTFLFQANDFGTYRQRVGAGTVLLTAIPDKDNGWQFDGWQPGPNLLPDENDPTIALYQTEKGDAITATFSVTTYIITPIASDNGGIDPSVPISVNHGSDKTFYFYPDTGYHVSAVIIDDDQYVTLIPTSFTASYTFYDVNDDHTIKAIFAEDGEAWVPEGEDVTIFLSSEASLTFDNVITANSAYGAVINWPDEVVVWDITVLATFDIKGENGEEEGAIVALKYDPKDLPFGFDPANLRLYTCTDSNFDKFLQCDFNDDGIVNGQDVKKISNIVKQTKFYPSDITTYDLAEPYGIIDENDIHVVNSFNGMNYLDFTWDDITYGPVDTINCVIYGFTQHFSLFRCR